MKFKSLLLVATMLVATSVAYAQEVFQPHWTIGLQAGAAYTMGKPAFKELITPDMQGSLGYQFTPNWGVRLAAFGRYAKTYDQTTTGYDVWKYYTIQTTADVIINLVNPRTYKQTRVFTPYAMVGIGASWITDNFTAIDRFSKMGDLEREKLAKERDGRTNLVVRAGLGGNFRLCKYVDFNIELIAQGMGDQFNQVADHKIDFQFAAMGGFIFRLGHNTCRKAPEPVEEPAPAPVVEEPAPAPVVAPAPVKETPKPEPVKVRKCEQNIQFAINSSEISVSEMAKVDVLADFLKKNPDAKVEICGYADKDTGTANYNKRLSGRRVDSVRKALEERGVESSRISSDYKGDTVQPFNTPEGNRVVIGIAQF